MGPGFCVLVRKDYVDICIYESELIFVINSAKLVWVVSWLSGVLQYHLAYAVK